MLKVLFISFLFLFPSHENEDDLYIQKVTSKPDKLIKCGTFENGHIFVHGDTIKTKILKFTKRKEMNSFLFCVVKNKADSIQIYTPKQIDGYSVGDENYKKHVSKDASFFIRLRKNGRANLYERVAIPSDNSYLYYLKLPKYIDYFILAPVHDRITFISLPTQPGAAAGNQFLYYNNQDNQNEKFKLFIKIYMPDCEELNSLVASDYFTINDIESIIDKYNNCPN